MFESNATSHLTVVDLGRTTDGDPDVLVVTIDHRLTAGVSWNRLDDQPIVAEAA